MKKLRIISTIAFLIIGLTLFIVVLAMKGWNFTKFISDPTVDLVILVSLIVLVLWWSGGTLNERR